MARLTFEQAEQGKGNSHEEENTLSVYLESILRSMGSRTTCTSPGTPVKYNQAVGLDTPDLTALSADFNH